MRTLRPQGVVFRELAGNLNPIAMGSISFNQSGMSTPHAMGQSLAGMVANVTLELPKSRTAEKEADDIGIELAARAGYNPQAAISLWQKMEKLASSQPPKWLSTHPPHADRVADLQNQAQKVMPLYQQAKAGGTASAGK